MQPSSNPKRGWIPPCNEEEQFLMKHCEDIARIAVTRDIERTSAFLSDREQSLAEAAMHRAGCENYVFWGGFSQAERKILIVNSERSDMEPIIALKVKASIPKDSVPLRHQDYLGSILGLNLERPSIGDIVPLSDSEAIIFVLPQAAQVILSELISIGRFRANAQQIGLTDLPESINKKDLVIQTGTVSSLRLDSVLSTMLHCSRNQAVELIKAGRVEINHIPTQNIHAPVYADDIFSVRGKGKFHLIDIPGTSKKDRFILSFCQY